MGLISFFSRSSDVSMVPVDAYTCDQRLLDHPFAIVPSVPGFTATVPTDKAFESVPDASVQKKDGGKMRIDAPGKTYSDSLFLRKYRSG